MDYELRITTAIKALQAGRPVIMLDDDNRENEGDLIYPAECITPAIMAMMIRYGSGIVCLSLTPEKIEQLGLPMMVSDNTSQYKTGFTVSIEAKIGVSTGVSADDRVRTILTAVAEGAKPGDLSRPGHVFPLRAMAHGVMQRPGHTEGSIDLVRLAGFKPAAVICELMNDDGTMQRGETLEQFAAAQQLPIVSIQDLIQYRLRHEILVEEAATSRIQLRAGQFTIKIFHDVVHGAEHTVLIKPWEEGTAPLVRVHSSCLTGDIFGSLHCDCGPQLDHALEVIGQQGGVLIYLNQEGRGIGLTNKIKAYALQAQGRDTVEANLDLGLPQDSRQYHFAAHILKYLGVDALRLLTNNPSKVAKLIQYGIKHVLREPTPTFKNALNQHYLNTKFQKMGHQLTNLEE